MLISIIIPTYNYGHCIAHAIDSVLLQADPNVQLIIIDDGSTDDTATVVQSYVQQAPHLIQYIKQNNLGVATVRNHGIQAAQGEYLLFLDADDRLLPKALEHFREFLAKSPQIDMLCGGHISIEPDGKTKQHPFTNPLSKNRLENFLGYLRKQFSPINSGTLFHKRVFTKLNYPEHIRSSEDISVFAHTLALFNCVSLAEPVVAIYKHTDSLRHQTHYSKDVETKIVDLIFDEKILPAKFLKFRQEYYAIRCLSLFRSLYLAKEYSEAEAFYKEAIKTNPWLLLKFSYLKKYLQTLFK